MPLVPSPGEIARWKHKYSKKKQQAVRDRTVQRPLAGAASAARLMRATDDSCHEPWCLLVK